MWCFFRPLSKAHRVTRTANADLSIGFAMAAVRPIRRKRKIGRRMNHARAEDAAASGFVSPTAFCGSPSPTCCPFRTKRHHAGSKELWSVEWQHLPERTAIRIERIAAVLPSDDSGPNKRSWTATAHFAPGVRRTIAKLDKAWTFRPLPPPSENGDALCASLTETGFRWTLRLALIEAGKHGSGMEAIIADCERLGGGKQGLASLLRVLPARAPANGYIADTRQYVSLRQV